MRRRYRRAAGAHSQTEPKQGHLRYVVSTLSIPILAES